MFRIWVIPYFVFILLVRALSPRDTSRTIPTESFIY